MIIYGFNSPYRELAASVIMRAVEDVKAARECRDDGAPCGARNMAGVHVCRAHARMFLRSSYAAQLMAGLGLDGAAVLEATGE